MATSWTAEQRSEALEMLRSGVGTNEVVRRTGVPVGTLCRWAKAAGIESPNAAQAEAASAATRIAWAQRRTALVDRLGELCDTLLDRIEADTGDPRGNAVAFGIFVDKAQLITGGATSRHEHADAERRRERVGALVDELAERRAVNG